jgi:hypothetical protein
MSGKRIFRMTTNKVEGRMMMKMVSSLESVSAGLIMSGRGLKKRSSIDQDE